MVSGDVPAGREPRSVDRGEEATGGAIEDVTAVLPGRALTESCQALHESPDRTGVRLMFFRQRVRLSGLLLRDFGLANGRLEYRVPRRSELLGGGAQEQGAVIRGVVVERCTHAVQRRRPRSLNRRPHVPAPEAGHVLETPDD